MLTGTPTRPDTKSPSLIEARAGDITVSAAQLIRRARAGTGRAHLGVLLAGNTGVASRKGFQSTVRETEPLKTLEKPCVRQLQKPELPLHAAP